MPDAPTQQHLRTENIAGPDINSSLCSALLVQRYRVREHYANAMHMRASERAYQVDAAAAAAAVASALMHASYNVQGNI